MLRKSAAIALSLSTALLGWSSLSAQEGLAAEKEMSEAELYGKGVHAYFDGSYDTAIRMFDTAVENGTTDPRVLYFRGLTKFEQEQVEGAREDFLSAARMELAGTPQYYPINRSLERIQGDGRQLLEEMRQFAREDSARRELAYRQARYEALRIAEAFVIRKPVQLPSQLPAVDLSQVPNLPFKQVVSGN